MISMLKFLAKKPYSEIDEKIKSLVDVMNGTGVITTVASCQGHSKFGFPPYVYFRTDVHTASLIEKALREFVMSNESAFRQEWVVQGRFDENCNLAFILFSPKYHKEAFTIYRRLRFGIFRRTLDGELLLLGDIVRNAVISKIRK